MFKRITSIFMQGFVAILPLAVTLFVLYWLGALAEGTLGQAIKWLLPQGWYVFGMGLVCGIGLIFIVGVLVNIWGVPHLIQLSERAIGRIPMVKTIYGAVRDLLGFFEKPGGTDVSKVVSVALTDTGIRAVGLLTRERFDDLPEGIGGEGEVTVYVPFSYQIGGLSLVVPIERVTPIDMPLEDAMRYIVTAGAKRRPGERRTSPQSAAQPPADESSSSTTP